jgi:restriction system protein
MPFPKQREIELPMLAAIENLGGTAKPKDVYPLVAAQFPELSPEEQTQTLESTPPSVRKWWNMVQWVRQHLVEVGELDGSTRGVWKITDAGRARRKREGHRPTKPGQQDRDINIRDLATANRDEVKRRLLTELKNLSPVQFEHFCSVLLQQLGFQSLTVTRRSGDGGIDGHGNFRQGAVSLRSAFQAKRWTDNAVGRPEIDRFEAPFKANSTTVCSSPRAVSHGRRWRHLTGRVPLRFCSWMARQSWGRWSNGALA